jgi:WD40 repeat protein
MEDSSMAAMPLDEQAIFEVARKLGAGEAREAYLLQICGGEAAIEQRVRALLKAYEESARFLESPAARLVATVDEQPVSEGPGTIIGPHKLLEQIGEGGFGVVFMAEQQHPVRRKVALKVLKPGMDTRQVVARFEAERQALALMDHPNIAHVFDGGETASGRPYFVMELVRGIPITEFCDQDQLPIRDRLELFLTVCQAVQHAHQKGIIHRDLKPSNILVTVHDIKPVVKVIDFGIAKATGQRLTEKTLFTHFAQMIGTPLYMSPEQAQLSGLDVDTRSDIYSLGVLLYELLTGTTPFDKERLRTAGYDEMRRIIREEEPVKPSTRISTLGQAATVVSTNRSSDPRRLAQHCRGELDWIVMKALEKDRNRRYESASAFAADVQRYLHDEPVHACPPSAGYRLRKFARRYWMPVAVTAAFALLLVAGGVVSTWQAVRATRAETQAVQQRDLATEAEGVANQRRQEAETARYAAEAAKYAASMGLLQAAWDNHNMLRVRDLLNETAKSPERGFEWYYWQRLCRVEHVPLLGHQGGVLALAFAPDGQRLVTGVTDGTARVWDLSSGREFLCLRGHRGEVMSVAYAPDGHWLVTGSMDGTARIWDAASGGELQVLRGRNTGPIRAVAVMPDGKRVVAGSEVWDSASGRILFTLKGHTPLPALAALTLGLVTAPQGQGPLLLASQLYPGTTGQINGVEAVTITPDGRRIVTGNGDGGASVWDATSGRELFHVQHRAVSAVAVTPDAKRVVTGNLYGEAKIWDLESGQAVEIPGGHGDLYGLALTPDGKRLLSGYYGGTANVRDLATRREILNLIGHKSLVTAVAISADGQRLATASLDGTARVWDVESGRATRNFREPTGRIDGATATLDGKWFVTVSEDDTVRLWDTETGRAVQHLERRVDNIASLAVSPDGQRIVTGTLEKWEEIGTRGSPAILWDAVSGRELLKLKPLQGQTGAVLAVTFTPDGQRIVTGNGDGTARVWDATNGRELLILKGHTGPVLRVAVTSDGQRIVSGSQDGTARIWDALSGRQLRQIDGHDGWIGSIAVTQDGQRLLTVGPTPHLWDIESGRQLLSLEGHVENNCVAVTPDGRRLITGSGDGTASIWDAASGRELLTLKGHSGPVRWVAVTSDGRHVITRADDGIVKIWEAASPAQVAGWDQQDQEAARRQAIWQRPVSGSFNEKSFIRDWLVLAPVGLAPGEGVVRGLEREQIQGEAKLKPRAGKLVRVDGREFTWQECHEQEPVLDFNRFAGKLNRLSAGYAVCYVMSAAEHNDVLLQISSDDMGKAYLNGREVYKCLRGGAVVPLDRVGPVTLHKGTNVLILKVVNGNWEWEGCARFVDPEGNPVKGLRVSLTPEEESDE